MTKAFRIHEYGGPEVLKWEDVTVGDPGPGQVRLRHTAVGLNFVDTYMRSGLYKLPSLPSGIGQEAAGVIEALGSGVTGFKIGQRVAYGIGPADAYSETRLFPAERLVALPDAIDDRTAAAIMLKGLTTWYLIRRIHPVQKGETILLHAAAGGVGQIATQWAKHLGATVIGTVGTDEKAEIAKARGCDHVIVYTREDFTKRVREITGGAGVPVVYDSVGAATFEGSLDCLRPTGLMVTFGNASGPAPAIQPGTLAAKGSLFLTRPRLGDYVPTHDLLLSAAKELFDVVTGGHVKIEINQTHPLAEAAQAQRALEARKTTGCTVLTP
ncbi:MAG: quinone oxidoreductase [Rhodospirillales bacterium]|nr:quinone oxidoreductase [Rhodospirillales bacterium]